MCQLCGRTCHVAIKCFKRFGIHFTSVDTQSTAATAGVPTGQGSNASQQAFMVDFGGSIDVGSGGYTDGEGNWYVDSGATTHITNDLSNLAISSEYSGGDNWKW